MKKDCDTCRHYDVDYDNMPCSLCEDFDEWESKTNADHIRSMTDEELAVTLYSVFDIDSLKIPFCKNKWECNDLIDADKEIPESMCLKCMLDWLKAVYKEDE